VEALTEIPEISPSRLTLDMAALLDAADEYDSLHDTICRVGGNSRRYALHSFILASGSETLAKQLKFAEAVNPTILDIEDNIQPVIFEQIVRYLYTRSCDLITPGPCSIVIEENNKKTTNGTTAAQSDDNENFITVEGDPAAVSAFAAYSEQRNRGKKKNARRTNQMASAAGEGPTTWGVTSAEVTSSGGRTGSATNPLVLLQEAAKSLGIASLVKIIDCLRLDAYNLIFKFKSNFKILLPNLIEYL
jgi:BTB/POZ domain